MNSNKLSLLLKSRIEYYIGSIEISLFSIIRFTLAQFVDVDTSSYIQQLFWSLHATNSSNEPVHSWLDTHTMILTRNNGLFSYGYNLNGQLGWGYDSENYMSNVQKVIIDETVIDVAAGGTHSLILTTNGLFACGSNCYGQLGLRKSGKPHYGELHDIYPSPVEVDKIDLNQNEKILSVACGLSHSAILTTKNVVFTSGDNNESQLGRQTTFIEDDHFERVGLRNVISIKCGDEFTMALVVNDIHKRKKHGKTSLYGWGSNRKCQLGMGQNHQSGERLYPKRVKNLPNNDDISLDVDILSFHCGETHTLVLKSDGLYGCGDNNHGQLGMNVFGARYCFYLTPLSMSISIFDKGLIQVFCHSSKTFILITKGNELFSYIPNCESRYESSFILKKLNLDLLKDEKIINMTHYEILTNHRLLKWDFIKSLSDELNNVIKVKEVVNIII